MRTWNSRQFPDAGFKGLNLPLTNGVDVMVELATVVNPSPGRRSIAGGASCPLVDETAP